MKTTNNLSTSTKYTDLVKTSLKNHANNGYLPYLLFFFTSVLCAAFILLNLFFSILYLILIPFVVIPLLFACQASVDLLNHRQNLTFGGYLKCFFIYFVERFRSSFQSLRALLAFVIVVSACLLTSIIIFFGVAINTDAFQFATFLNELENTRMADLNAIEELLNNYSRTVDMVLVCTVLPSITLGSFIFAYFVSKSGVFLPFRLSEDIKYTGKYISTVSNRIMKKKRSLFLKCYWSLNWPMVILFIGSFCLGGYIGYLYKYNFNSIFTFGLAIALIIPFTLFGPMYYANKQTICDLLVPAYREEETKLQSEINEQFTGILKELEKLQNDTKKDSDES